MFRSEVLPHSLELIRGSIEASLFQIIVILSHNVLFSPILF